VHQLRQLAVGREVRRLGAPTHQEAVRAEVVVQGQQHAAVVGLDAQAGRGIRAHVAQPRDLPLAQRLGGGGRRGIVVQPAAPAGASTSMRR
jgi:hypothetical protein